MPDRQGQSQEYRFGYQSLFRSFGRQFAEHDGETGFDQFELRLYDSRLGRWMSPDPYGQYYSPYLAMGNNPISGVDPDGGLFGRIRSWFNAQSTGGYNFKNSNNDWVTVYDNGTYKNFGGSFLKGTTGGNFGYAEPPTKMFVLDANNNISKDQSLDVFANYSKSYARKQERYAKRHDNFTAVINENRPQVEALINEYNESIKRREAQKWESWNNPHSDIGMSHWRFYRDMDLYEWYTNHPDQEYARQWIISNSIGLRLPFLFDENGKLKQ